MSTAPDEIKRVFTWVQVALKEAKEDATFKINCFDVNFEQHGRRIADFKRSFK